MPGSRLSLAGMAIYAAAFLVALTVHEYAHARAALAAGDDTAKQAGRVSLNPLVHLDVYGTILFVFTLMAGFGIAWGKPVPVNPMRMKDPRWDSLKVSLWGPLSNIILAFALSMVFRFAGESLSPLVGTLLATCIFFNLAVAFFNLIPVSPLDGSHILAALLPAEAARGYAYAMSRYGLLILAAVLLVHVGGRSVVGWVIGPPISLFIRLFIGTGF